MLKKGPNCEVSVYCNSSFGNEICGGPGRCKTFNKNYVCDCEKPLIGHACQKSKNLKNLKYLKE